jgi:hypothetical protein
MNEVPQGHAIPSEISNRDARNAVASVNESGVAVNVDDICVVDDRDIADGHIVAPIPGSVDFVRRQRDPSDISEAETGIDGHAA